MTIICYEDPGTGERKWEESPGSAEVSMALFNKAHPGLEPLYQFVPTESLVPWDDAPWRRSFGKDCADAGLRPEHLDGELYLDNGHRAFLRGIYPRRVGGRLTRNCMVVWDCARQAFVRTDPEQVRRGLGKTVRD